MKIKNLFKDFIDSFKPKISWLYIMLFDFLFYGISILVIKAVGSYLTKKSAAINLPDITNLNALNPADLEAIAMQMQNLFITIVVLITLVLIVILLGWSLSRGLIYSILLKKKFTKKSFGKFTLLNLFLFITIFVILVFFTAVGAVLATLITSYRYVFFVIFLAIIYYLSLNYIFFTKKNKVFESIGKALTFGTKNMLTLFIPCLLILIVSLLLSRLQLIISIQAQIAPFLSLVIFVIFMAWARNYFVQTVEKIKGG